MDRDSIISIASYGLCPIFNRFYVSVPYIFAMEELSLFHVT